MVQGPGRIGYVVVQFPKVTETFVLREMLALIDLGVQVHLFSLKTVRDYPVHHPGSEKIQNRTHYSPFVFSLSVWFANLYYLFRKPRRYLSLIGYLVRHTRRSRRLFIRSIGLLPKCVRFARTAEALSLDRVHAHFARQPAICGMIINWLTGIPYSVTPHAGDIFINSVMLDEMLRRADLVVAISDFNRNFFYRICPDVDRRRIHSIRYGLALGDYPPKTDHDICGTVKILCVASLMKKKGLPYLIEACRILRERGLDYCCTIIGEERERRHLEELVSRVRLGERVRMPGIFPHDRVIRFYLESDIFVLPSIVAEDGDTEGLPNALIEALALGVPAVSTRVSGIPELLRDGETGLLVEPGDPRALADAVERMIRDTDLRRRVAAGGRREVFRRHDISKNVYRLYTLFSERRVASKGGLVSAPGRSIRTLQPSGRQAGSPLRIM